MHNAEPPEFSLISPIYNEAANIETHLRGIQAHVKGRYEIVLVYDVPDDSTLPVLESLNPAIPNIRLVRNDLGRGVVNAIKTGFKQSRGWLGSVVTMADLSDPPIYINALVEKLREGCDVVAGSRYMRGGKQHAGPVLKGMMSWLSGILAYWLTGIGIHDVTTNFRAYSRRLMETLPIESQGGFELGLELTVKSHLKGWKIGETPAEWFDRKAGQSQFRILKLLPGYLKWYSMLLWGDPLGWGSRQRSEQAWPKPSGYGYFGVYEKPGYGWIARRYRPGIVIVATTSSDRTIWIRCQRPYHADGQDGWELPGGILEEGEDPAETAHRELREETGYESSGPAHADSNCWEAMPGMGSYPHTVVTLKDCRSVSAPSEGHEGILEVRELDSTEVQEFIRSGRIQSLPSIAAYFMQGGLE